jgi:L,D-peptidoglycan transpeptidase YkuD (ErfK/YbiS/YcfS/YnhG family)
MNPFRHIVYPALLTVVWFLSSAQANGPSDLRVARQLVLVTTPGWHSTGGTLQMFSRPDTAGAWIQKGNAFPVVVGRSGLAWEAAQGATDDVSIVKHEGDGRSPAGVFRLTFAFGFSPPSQAAPLHLPYRRITGTWKCIDDPQSRYYNMVLDSAAIDNPDWKSAEDMRRIDPAYAWGVFVACNTAPIRPGEGSCIFLHVWDGPASTTSGCTAMEETHVLEVIHWLDTNALPVLVQLPVEEYLRRKKSWGLP